MFSVNVFIVPQYGGTHLKVTRVVSGLKKFDHISQGRRSLKWLDVTEKVLFNDLVLVLKCVNGLAPDYLGKYFIKHSAGRTQGDVTILWSPEVDCQWDKEHFIFGVQGEWNGLANNIKNT